MFSPHVHLVIARQHQRELLATATPRRAQAVRPLGPRRQRLARPFAYRLLGIPAPSLTAEGC